MNRALIIVDMQVDFVTGSLGTKEAERIVPAVVKKIETEKVWKKINEDGEKRYTRCLTFDYNDQTYIADSICKTLSIINKDNLDKELFTFNPEENEYPYYGG